MHKVNKPRTVALATLGVMVSSLLGGALVTPASANAKTWKKVTIGAGVVTGYGLLAGKGRVAPPGATAPAGSYLKYRHDKKKEQRRAAWRRRHLRHHRRHHHVVHH